MSDPVYPENLFGHLPELWWRACGGTNESMCRECPVCRKRFRTAITTETEEGLVRFKDRGDKGTHLSLRDDSKLFTLEENKKKRPGKTVPLRKLA